MFGKDWTVRWNETIDYLNKKFPCPGSPFPLGVHIENTVPAFHREGISKQLSIGYRTDGEDDPNYVTKTDKRHALRGLFLCQRVYYSELWAQRGNFEGTEVAPCSSLVPNWRTESMNFWKDKSEQEILDAIGMFAPIPNTKREDLQAAAFAGPPVYENRETLPGNLKLSRRDAKLTGANETCYNGVTAWLVKSGLASMRWFMQDSAPNNQFCCDRLFGKGEEVWRGPFKPGDKVPDIPAGYIVHMWSPENFNWNGHWVVSNGDGTICGVNNGEIKGSNGQPDVKKAYTNHGTLQDQFESGYGGMAPDGVRWKTAVMVKIDPLAIPNLM